MQSNYYSERERDLNSTTVPPVQAISNSTKLTLKRHRIDTILALGFAGATAILPIRKDPPYRVFYLPDHPISHQDLGSRQLLKMGIDYFEH
jgi:hypothetical protein